MAMLVTFKPQRTAVKGCKDVRCEAAPGVLFVPSVLCCKHPPKGGPVEGALLTGERRKGQRCPRATLVPAAFCIHVRVTLHLWGIYSQLCPQFTSWFHLNAGQRKHQAAACMKVHIKVRMVRAKTVL